MTASDIATSLIPALLGQGFNAVRHPEPTPNGYGHKITLFEQAGPALGTLIIYAGKNGPRYTTNELRNLTPQIQARLAQAWTDSGLLLTNATTPHHSSSVPTPVSPPNTVELWVDGACLQHPDGLKFGWACVIRENENEVYRHSSSQIPAHAADHRNVAAELQAVLHGLEECRRRGYHTITVYYDYTGIEAWATGQWRANTPATQAYAAYTHTYSSTIKWHKVTAHSGVLMNDLVDSLATAAARSAPLVWTTFPTQ